MSVLISSPKTHALPFGVDVAINGGGGVDDGGAGARDDEAGLDLVESVPGGGRVLLLLLWLFTSGIS